MISVPFKNIIIWSWKSQATETDLGPVISVIWLDAAHASVRAVDGRSESNTLKGNQGFANYF